MKKIIYFLVLVICVCYSCNNDVDPSILNCDEKIIILL